MNIDLKKKCCEKKSDGSMHKTHVQWGSDEDQYMQIYLSFAIWIAICILFN